MRNNSISFDFIISVTTGVITRVKLYTQEDDIHEKWLEKSDKLWVCKSLWRYETKKKQERMLWQDEHNTTMNWYNHVTKVMPKY